MKKRIFASVMALFMIFTLLSPVEVRAEENYGVSITLPEGAEVVELTDETESATDSDFEQSTDNSNKKLELPIISITCAIIIILVVIIVIAIILKNRKNNNQITE